jgi:hypothetical protein
MGHLGHLGHLYLYYTYEEDSVYMCAYVGVVLYRGYGNRCPGCPVVSQLNDSAHLDFFDLPQRDTSLTFIFQKKEINRWGLDRVLET